jgi:hypothetical protein
MLVLVTTAREHFDAIAADQLAYPEVATGRMFSAHGVKLRGKFFAFLMRDERLVVKLPESRVRELVDGGLAVQFEPGPGKKMREWASLAYADEDDPAWEPLVDEARAFVESITG